MRSLNTVIRSVRVAEHLLTGAAVALVIAALRAAGGRPGWVPAVVRWWHGRLCRALDLEVEVSGNLAPGALLVANHVSWLDIPVLGARGPVQFLSKAEVRDWPLVGWMAAVAGTLFIARGAHQAGGILDLIGEHVRAGVPVVIFPEGTTTDGRAVRRFHPRLFAAAQRAGLRVQPIAIRYGADGDPDPIAPFVGDDDLVSHLLRVVAHPGLTVRVRLLPPLESGMTDRRSLAEQCRQAIAGSLSPAPGAASAACRASRATAPGQPLEAAG
jgi:1-acyl-sn-glycerol-3-phosphate acyltransferase